jgi:hypothetical protein
MAETREVLRRLTCDRFADFGEKLEAAYNTAKKLNTTTVSDESLYPCPLLSECRKEENSLDDEIGEIAMKLVICLLSYIIETDKNIDFAEDMEG